MTREAGERLFEAIGQLPDGFILEAERDGLGEEAHADVLAGNKADGQDGRKGLAGGMGNSASDLESQQAPGMASQEAGEPASLEVSGLPQQKAGEPGSLEVSGLPQQKSGEPGSRKAQGTTLQEDRPGRQQPGKGRMAKAGRYLKYLPAAACFCVVLGVMSWAANLRMGRAPSQKASMAENNDMEASKESYGFAGAGGYSDGDGAAEQEDAKEDGGISEGPAMSGGSGQPLLPVRYDAYEGPVLPLTATGDTQKLGTARRLKGTITAEDTGAGSQPLLQITDIYQIKNTSKADKTLQFVYPFVTTLNLAYGMDGEVLSIEGQEHMDLGNKASVDYSIGDSVRFYCGQISAKPSAADDNGQAPSEPSAADDAGRALPESFTAGDNGRVLSEPSAAGNSGQAPSGISAAGNNGQAPSGISVGGNNGQAPSGPSTAEDYTQLLDKKTGYQEQALAKEADWDKEVSVYTFSGIQAQEGLEGFGVAGVTVTGANADVLTYGFDHLAQAEEGVANYCFFISGQHERRYLIVAGEQAGEPELGFYTNLDCEEELEGVQCEMRRQKMSYSDALRLCSDAAAKQLAADYAKGMYEGELPEYMDGNAAFAALTVMGDEETFYDTLMGRYQSTELKEIFGKLFGETRVVYAMATVTVPAGKSIQVTARTQKRQSQGHYALMDKDAGGREDYRYDILPGTQSHLSIGKTAFQLVLPDGWQIKEDDMGLERKKASVWKAVIDKKARYFTVRKSSKQVDG